MSTEAGRGWRALTARQRGVLAATIAANALVFLDQTAVTVALPAIGTAFDAETELLPWVVNAYLLALATFMLLAGRVADRYGRRETFLVGLLVFGLGSAFCALAPSLPLLILARFIQGIGGAVVQPLALGNTTRAVSDDQRTWAIGILATGGSALLVFGPLIAGALLAVTGWRSIFLINLPIVAIALVIGFRTITRSRQEDAPPIAWTSAVLLLIALTGVVVGAVQLVATSERQDLLPLLLLVTGLIAGAAFIVVELRSANPLIGLSNLRDWMLTTSLVTLFCIQFAVLALTVLLAIYLQRDLSLTAFGAGVVIALAGVGSPLFAARAGRLTDRAGPRRYVVPGLALATTGLLLLAWLAPERVLLLLAPGLLFFVISRPLVFTPASAGPFIALGVERRALAASLTTEARQLGAVAGVALTGIVLAAQPAQPVTGPDPGISDGLRLALIIAAALCGAALLLTAVKMPRTTAPRQTATADRGEALEE